MKPTEKKLVLEDLVPGDVLVMQGAQDVSWVSIIEKGDLDAALIQAIMWLTNSDVCHGAIYYGQQNGVFSLIDDGEKGVGQHGMTQENGQGDHWYVRRMQGVNSLQAVLAQAMHYKNIPTAYDWELLTLLGLLLIYKKITPNNQYYQELLVLLEKLVVSIDQLTHKKSVDYFVCSQFVAACFDQAGAEYELDVVNGDLSAQPNKGVTVLDHCLSFQSTQDKSMPTQDITETSPLQVNDLHAFVNADEYSDQHSPTVESQNRMYLACDRFLNLFFKINASVLGLSATDYDSSEKRMQLAQQYQADFVTPADLKSHCANLSPIGMIQFIYGKAMP